MIGYALIMVLIAVASIGALKTVGQSTSDSFESVSTSVPGGGVVTPELTPKEKWNLAQADYKEALSKAKAEKAGQIAAAKKTYQEELKINKTLSKAEKKVANKTSKKTFNTEKSNANSAYKTAVKEAQAARSAAKAVYNATK